VKKRKGRKSKDDKDGDSGPFLIFLLESPARAQVVVQRLQAAGLKTAARLAEYGLHIYYTRARQVLPPPLGPGGRLKVAPRKDKQSLINFGACC
jgi:hypothetical protein